MQIHKKRIIKEDGRYLIYYAFTDKNYKIVICNSKIEHGLVDSKL